MYKIINEDNSLVSEYPSDILYGMLSDKEKEHINFFKKEIDKLTEKEGLGKITVSLNYEGSVMEKEFQIKDRNGYTFQEFEEIEDKIRDHMTDICKNDEELYEFYRNAHIISA